MKEGKKFAWLVGIFLFACYIPLGNPKVTQAILESFRLLQWYAVNHTLACVVPAMFIAGAISTFLSQGSVMRYIGPDSNRALAYGVASVSGAVLAVCSCSVLPMFAGIYAIGAGLGPASAFLYSGPAINVMAIFLSARVLGFDLGLARSIAPRSPGGCRPSCRRSYFRGGYWIVHGSHFPGRRSTQGWRNLSAGSSAESAAAVEDNALFPVHDPFFGFFRLV